MSAPLLTTKDVDACIPSLAKETGGRAKVMTQIRKLPTTHRLLLGDARSLVGIESGSVHLIVTSPPYWNLKDYPEARGQLGAVTNYEQFLGGLSKAWAECYRVLIPGGRLVIVVGDVCLSRRATGRHRVVPLHADIQVGCRTAGFDNLAPIFWYKIANASYEAKGNGAGFFGKPYEPNAIVKNDVEFILMERKPGPYRKPDPATRLLSYLPVEDYKRWFRQVWDDIQGESARTHPAPFPVELAERLIRMFGFVGDTVLDPFMGTGSTNLAAARSGRNSIGVDVDRTFVLGAERRLNLEAAKDRAPWKVSIGGTKATRF